MANNIGFISNGHVTANGWDERIRRQILCILCASEIGSVARRLPVWQSANLATKYSEYGIQMVCY